MNNKIKAGLAGVALILGIIMFFSLTGTNDSGYRTVIQYPNGTMSVKFTAGWYLKLFGKTEEYPDNITYDFDKTVSEEQATLDVQGIGVRYQDGGTGTIFGVARFNLPNDDDGMLKLHKAFRSHRGLAFKLIKVVTDESNNLTAGLMSSEEAYAEKRGIFTEWSQTQLKRGKFKTELSQIKTEDETGRFVTKNVPIIKMGDDGLPEHINGDLETYGVTVSGYQITDWNFEDKTLKQISAKREATMAIITAIAQAEQAKQEQITAEAKGKSAVTTAQYEKEVEKKRAIVEAEQKAEVAVIEAQQLVSVSQQQLLQAEQKKLAANEYKEEQILIGEGESERKRLVIEADGALEQKLKAWVAVNSYYASAVSKQRWVPELQFTSGSGEGGTSNQASALIDLLTAKTAKDISLDMKIDNNQ